ncbi:hypothetical protein ACFGVR_03540 [Mucilaginibacter sp. AW1-3]
MKYLKLLLVLIVFGLTVLSAHPVKAQCAVCSVTVETNHQNGGNQARGLNAGIMYLLAAPYIVAGVGGFIWYRNYKRKQIRFNVRNEKLNLN